MAFQCAPLFRNARNAALRTKSFLGLRRYGIVTVPELHAPSRLIQNDSKPREQVTCVAGASAVVQFAVDPALVKTAFTATSKLFITTLIGVFAAAKGLLDKNTLQALSKTVYYIFLPSLLLTNVVTTLASGGSVQLVWLPIAALVQILFGMIAGILGSRLLKLNPTESRVYLVCTAWGNSAALPLLYANALFDTPAQLAAMVSGISFFLLGWSGVFWGLGFHLLSTLPDNEEDSSSTKKARTPSFNVKVKQILSRVFSPPLIASIIGLAIGLISPSLRDLFIRSPVFSALRTLGAGYSPVAVLVLAGSLARRIGQKSTNSDEKLSSAASSMRIGRMSVGITLTRFLYMPLIGLAMVYFGSAKFFTTPMVKLVVLLQAIMPPAQNSTLILNMEGKGDAASQVARVLLGIYTFGIIPICVGLSIFLSVAGI